VVFLGMSGVVKSWRFPDLSIKLSDSVKPLQIAYRAARDQVLWL